MLSFIKEWVYKYTKWPTKEQMAQKKNVIVMCIQKVGLDYAVEKATQPKPVFEGMKVGFCRVVVEVCRKTRYSTGVAVRAVMMSTYSPISLEVWMCATTTNVLPRNQLQTMPPNYRIVQISTQAGC